MAALEEPYKSWFVVADADKDGLIAGGEAVAFMTRSGLDKPILKRVRLVRCTCGCQTGLTPDFGDACGRLSAELSWEPVLASFEQSRQTASRPRSARAGSLLCCITAMPPGFWLSARR